MYLAIMLICVALLIFYNEVNSKMNISEYILLAIALLAIIKASINYIQINKVNEGFVSNNYKKKNNSSSSSNSSNSSSNDDHDSIIINSEDSDEYLDSDELYHNTNSKNKNKNSFNSIDNARYSNKINLNSVKLIDDIISNKSDMSKFTNTSKLVEKYYDIPTPTPTNSNSNSRSNDGDNDKEINSSFNPKVIIGNGKGNGKGFGSSGDYSAWNSAFANDGFKFNNTMNPVNNLWRDTNGYYTDGSCNSSNTTKSINSDQWAQNMDEYNKGHWNKNAYDKASDYVDYTNPIAKSIGTNPSPTGTNSTTNKKCEDYDNKYENQAGDLVIKDYTQSKKWVAGYTYVPPVHWDVPQKHPGICRSNGPNVHKLTGLVDRGLPLNVLELDQYGHVADTEDSVQLTNIGSILPNFNYQEEPYSKPYI